jgi:hypothetical protein
MSKVLEIALSEVGTEETPRGSNWGPRVKEYLAAGGITVPAPWCMAFVCWCFRQTSTPSYHIQFPVTASCSFFLNWAKEKNRIVKKPLPGDIFLLVRPNGAAFHTGFVTAPGLLRFGTVEGNSNPGGSPEGFEVVKRSRSYRGVVFVRL